MEYPVHTFFLHFLIILLTARVLAECASLWTSPFIWWFSLSLIVVAIVGKLASAFLVRERWPVRFAVGLAMVPRGEVGLIFAELGRTSGIFGNEAYAALIIVIAVTTLAGPLLLKLYYLRNGNTPGSLGPE